MQMNGSNVLSGDISIKVEENDVPRMYPGASQESSHNSAIQTGALYPRPRGRPRANDNPTPFKCVQCDKDFVNKHSLMIHRESKIHLAQLHLGTVSESESNEYSMEDPETTASSSSSAQQSTQQPNSKPFPCDLCELGYESRRALMLHRKIKHIDSVQPPTTSASPQSPSVVMAEKRTAVSPSPPGHAYEEEDELIVPYKKTRNDNMNVEDVVEVNTEDDPLQSSTMVVHHPNINYDGEVMLENDEPRRIQVNRYTTEASTLNPKISNGKETRAQENGPTGSSQQKQVHSSASSSSFDHSNLSNPPSLFSSSEQAILNDPKVAVNDPLIIEKANPPHNMMDNSSGNVVVVGDGDTSLNVSKVAATKVDKKIKSIVVRLSDSEEFLLHMLTHSSETQIEHSNVLDYVDREFGTLRALICELKIDGHEELATQWTKRKNTIWSQIIAYKTRFGFLNID